MLHDRDYMRDSGRHAWSETLWPDAVTLLIIINAVVFVAQHFFGIGVDHVDGKIIPWGELSIAALQEGRVWTILTHMFVHQGIFHILVNCLTLFFVGKSVQSLLGTRPFLYIYFISGLVGAALELVLQPFLKAPMLGASGCIAGVFMALAVLLPQEEITSFIFCIVPVRMRLWTLARIFLGISILLGGLQLAGVFDSGIANFAHLGGALAGWCAARYMGYGGPGFTYDQLWTERPAAQEQSHEYAGVKARRRVVDLDETEWSPTSMSAKEFIEKEINPILEKISAHGLGSLTVEEKKLLERARTEILNRDNRR